MLGVQQVAYPSNATLNTRAKAPTANRNSMAKLALLLLWRPPWPADLDFYPCAVPTPIRTASNRYVVLQFLPAVFDCLLGALLSTSDWIAELTRAPQRIVQ